MPIDAHELLANHIEHDEIRDAKVDEVVKGIATDIKLIKENHLAHMQASMTQFEGVMDKVQLSIAKLETNFEWIKWGVLALVSGILTLVFKTVFKS